MKFKVKNTFIDIKFNYQSVYKINKALSNKSDDGEAMTDGVANLFTRLESEDDSVFIDVVKLFAPKKLTLSDDDVLDAIAATIDEKVETEGLDEESAYSGIFTELKQEAVASGFFKKKLKDYVKVLDSVIEALKGQNPTTETIGQIKLFEELRTKIGDVTS